MDKIELAYIGGKFYLASGTRMSSLIEVGSDNSRPRRWDWSMVQGALSQGKEVHIRPATLSEIGEAHKRLQALKAR